MKSIRVVAFAITGGGVLVNVMALAVDIRDHRYGLAAINVIALIICAASFLSVARVGSAA